MPCSIWHSRLDGSACAASDSESSNPTDALRCPGQQAPGRGALMRYRAWLALGLLFLGLPVPTGEAAAPDRVPPRLRQQVQTQGSVRVIVRLHLPSGPYKAESELPPAG